jgi:release factor glutamine methyltransferase
MQTRSRSIRELLRWGERHLVENGVPNARKNVEWMLGHILNRRSTDLYLTAAETPPADKTRSFEEMVGRRGAREPLQYLLGSTEFMGLPFLVSPGVFIPRPDTETLVERVERLITGGRGKAPVLLDLCCGSGVIAVSLARRLPDTTVVAVDVSPQAVDLTARNATVNGVQDKVDAVLRDALKYLETCRRRFDGVVCNPPYVPRPDLPQLPPEIQMHEPPLGLDGGEDGLDFYRASIPMIRRVLHPGGFVAFEMGSDQGASIADLLREASLGTVMINRDFAGAERVIVASAGQ